jgi:hypothetical protein
MSHALSCATSMVYWDYSAEDQGSHTLFEVVGMMARILGCPTTPGGSTLLMSGLDPHSQ